PHARRQLFARLIETLQRLRAVPVQREPHRLIAERLPDERIALRLDRETARFFPSLVGFVRATLELAYPRKAFERLRAQRHVVQRLRAARAFLQQRLAL